MSNWDTRIGTPLENDFFARPTVTVAQDLLGCWLIHESPEGRLAGRIVETESYGGAEDSASHACRGLTPRNRPMFGLVGHSYVYFIYGVHHCFNVVAHPQGIPGAVLIRALELADEQGRGPGKLCKSMGIDRTLNAQALNGAPLWLANDLTPGSSWTIHQGPRIGISKAKDLPHRFWWRDHPCVTSVSLTQ